MRATLVICLCFLTLASCDNWAVIVAGSNTYSNYRHQSNVYHLYKILRTFGMPESNIITFAYDDIANNKRNPIPGQVFNRPDGEDVYAGVKIDFVGEDVTASNFIAALTGDASSIRTTDPRSTPKVLQSTQNDHVFVYYSDHGGDNIIAFPNEYLYADELNNALKTMHSKNMYSKLVFYLEACHSGSMFANWLPSDINVYAVSAARPNEDHYGTYCGSAAVVHGINIGSCLGGQFSTSFMEDVDAQGQGLASETLQQQFELLQQKVTLSHVVQYGDVSFVNSDSLYNYISGTAKKFLAKLIKIVVGAFRTLEEDKNVLVSGTKARLEYYKNLAESTNDLSDQMEYYTEITKEAISQKRFKLFSKMFNLPSESLNTKVDFSCYKRLVNKYAQKCDALIDRDYKYMTNFANFCRAGLNVEEAEGALDKLC